MNNRSNDEFTRSNKSFARFQTEAVKNELSLALEWSRRVNQAAADIVRDVPPFPYVRESLKKVSTVADIIVVSATLGEALDQHDLAKYVRVIAGQEMNSKEEHLVMT